MTGSLTSPGAHSPSRLLKPMYRIEMIHSYTRWSAAILWPILITTGVNNTFTFQKEHFGSHDRVLDYNKQTRFLRIQKMTLCTVTCIKCATIRLQSIINGPVGARPAKCLCRMIRIAIF